jgi:hypothetical protein
MRASPALLILPTLLLASGAASARVLVTMNDADRLATRISHQISSDNSLAQQLDTAMSASGISSARIPGLRGAILRRLSFDATRIAEGLEGKSFDSPDGAWDILEHRLQILRFDAVNQPTLYAAGSPLRFKVNDAEAARLARSLPVLWTDREGALREKLDELSSSGLSSTDYQSLRNWAKNACLAKGREALEELKGSALFNQGDAEVYLGYAIDNEVDTIRTDRLSDETARNQLLEELRSERPADTVETSAASTDDLSWR